MAATLNADRRPKTKRNCSKQSNLLSQQYAKDEMYHQLESTLLDRSADTSSIYEAQAVQENSVASWWTEPGAPCNDTDVFKSDWMQTAYVAGLDASIEEHDSI